MYERSLQEVFNTTKLQAVAFELRLFCTFAAMRIKPKCNFFDSDPYY